MQEIGDRRQTKQFCFLDADCLVVGKARAVLGVRPGDTL